MDLNDHLVKLFCPSDAMVLVAACSGDHSSVADALTRLVGEATAKTVASVIYDAACKLLGTACEINQDVVGSWLVWSAIDVLHSRREVSGACWTSVSQVQLGHRFDEGA